MPRRSKAALASLKLRREVTDLPRMKSAVTYMRGTTHASQLSLGARSYSTREVFGAERLSFRSQCARSVLMKSQLLICLLVSLSPMPSLSTAEHQVYFLILKVTSAESLAYVAEVVRSLVHCVTLDQRNKCCFLRAVHDIII